MLRLLLTNDDGYKAAGIRALFTELSKQYDVVAVAPAHEQSWVAKSISRHRDLSLNEVTYEEFRGYSVDGTPADCAQIGIYQVLKELPDFVISGINHGSNVGHEEILSSGTVGAALEASLQGIPAFAVSISSSRSKDAANDFHAGDISVKLTIAARITRRIVDKVMTQGFPTGIQIISINMPYNVTEDAHWVVTKPHQARHEKLFSRVDDMYRHRGGVGLIDDIDAGSDLAALNEGYVSILPIKIELTSEAEQANLAKILDVPIFSN
jgi:5'-nucleotidase